MSATDKPLFYPARSWIIDRRLSYQKRNEEMIYLIQPCHWEEGNFVQYRTVYRLAHLHTTLNPRQVSSGQFCTTFAAHPTCQVGQISQSGREICYHEKNPEKVCFQTLRNCASTSKFERICLNSTSTLSNRGYSKYIGA